MFYARPFGARAFPDVCAHQGGRHAISSSCWFPSPASSISRRRARALADRHLGVVLAARVNLEPRPRHRRYAGRMRRASPTLQACVEIARRSAPRSSAGRSTARRSCSPAGRRRPCPEDERSGARIDGSSRGSGAPAQTRRKRRRSVLAVEPLNRFETDIGNTAAPALRARRGGRLSGGRRHARHVPHEHGGSDMLDHAIRQAGRRSRPFPGEREPSRLRRHRPCRLAADCRALQRSAIAGRSRWNRSAATTRRLGVPLAQWRAAARDEDTDLAASVGLSARERWRRAAGMSPLRIGWIGCGTHANEMLLPQLARHDVVLAALCDIDRPTRLGADGPALRRPRGAHARATGTHCWRAATSMRSASPRAQRPMLRSDPPRLARGLPLFIEKPPAADAASAKALAGGGRESPASRALSAS